MTKLPTEDWKRFNRACVDSPREADTYQITLRDNDIVIAYVRRGSYLSISIFTIAPDRWLGGQRFSVRNDINMQPCRANSWFRRSERTDHGGPHRGLRAPVHGK